MALSPKWSEEARKNVKETSIDERMRERMILQRERMAADMAVQKPQTAAPVASIPSYAEAVRKPAASIQEKEENIVETKDMVSEIYERLMPAIAKTVREELAKLAKEGRLN